MAREKYSLESSVREREGERRGGLTNDDDEQLLLITQYNYDCPLSPRAYKLPRSGLSFH
jgi:hypothetical protein